MAPTVWIAEDVVGLSDILEILQTKVDGGSTTRTKKKLTLLDIVELVERGGSVGSSASDLIDVEKTQDRGNGLRFDIFMKKAWVSRMKTLSPAFAAVCEIANGVRKMDPRCSKAKVDWHVMSVLPGCKKQQIHVDDGGERCYYTLILPLTSDMNSGGTYFPSLDHTFSRLGGVLVFHGTVAHAGMANMSKKRRIFLYAAIYTKRDFNVV